MLPRAYPQQHVLPCVSLESDWQLRVQATKETREGFFFMKPNKVGSSTAIGVHLRIARNAAMRTHGHAALLISPTNCTTICKSRWGHAQVRRSRRRYQHSSDQAPPSPASVLFLNRTKEASFLWTILRHPTQRAISSFFHLQVSRDGVEPSDENFLRYLEHKPNDYYVSTLPVTALSFGSQHDPTAATIVQTILSDYDFIAITERMDESLVVLSFLLQVPLTDLLYLSAKQSHGQASYDNMNPCHKLQKSFVSPVMEEFLQGYQWQDSIRKDLALYWAANQSLDHTIDRVMGRAHFEQQLETFRAMQRTVEKECRMSAIFPCDGHGVYHADTDCLWMDSGCGTPCLDRVAAEYEDTGA